MNRFIERFAEVQGITYEEAEQQVGAGTDEEILQNIQKITTEIINEKAQIKLNRAQRRALAKKKGKKQIGENPIETIADTTRKLDYISLIQKLRELNEKQENEGNDTAI